MARDRENVCITTATANRNACTHETRMVVSHQNFPTMKTGFSWVRNEIVVLDQIKWSKFSGQNFMKTDTLSCDEQGSVWDNRDPIDYSNVYIMTVAVTKWIRRLPPKGQMSEFQIRRSLRCSRATPHRPALYQTWDPVWHYASPSFRVPSFCV